MAELQLTGNTKRAKFSKEYQRASLFAFSHKADDHLPAV